MMCFPVKQSLCIYFITYLLYIIITLRVDGGRAQWSRKHYIIIVRGTARNYKLIRRGYTRSGRNEAQNKSERSAK